MKRGLSKKEITILIISVILVAFFVFLPTWASYRAATLSGPRLIAQDSEKRIWVEDNTAIYILDSDGNLLRTHYIEWLGIAPPLASFSPMPDGGMLVGSRETGLIHRVGRDLTTTGVIDFSKATIGRPFGAFHLLYDNERNEIYLSDTSNHRVIVTNPSGAILRGKGSTGTPGFFFFPNTMVIDKTGKILVADTNNHEIKVLSKDLELESTINPVPVSESYFVWPALVGIDGEGRIYVVNYSNGMDYGALVRLDETGEIETTFPLKKGIMLVSMLVRDKDVLLTDKKDFTIYRIDSESMEVSLFGSEALQSIFTASRLKVKLYHIIKTASRYLLVIFLFVLLIFLAIERKRRAATEKATATMGKGLPAQPVSSFLVWVPIIAVFGVMMVVLVLLAVVTCLPAPFICRPLATLVILAVIIVLSVACLVFIISWSRSRALVQYANNKIFNRHASAIRKCIPTDEPILLLGICQIKFEPIFLVATNNRFILFSMNRFFTVIMGIQEVSFHSIARVSMSRRTIANKARLARVRCIFSLKGLSKNFVLKFRDYNTAKQLLEMVETQRKGRAIEAPAIRNRCKICCSILDLQGNCPSCGVRAASMWKPILLSVLLPGLGQLYHRDLFKGCLFIILYGLLIIFLLAPVAALVHRFAAVDMIDLAVRIGTAFFVWTISLISTIHVSYKNRYRRWGLRL